ncbi:hypothetical protein [Mesorhizobium marinum]
MQPKSVHTVNSKTLSPRLSSLTKGAYSAWHAHPMKKMISPALT